MRDYHDFTPEYIGTSDKAMLDIVGFDGACKLTFGEDASYFAYIIDEDIDVPIHYKPVYKTRRWLLLIDDYGEVKRFEADSIEVYRAGLRGCIIKLIYDIDSFYTKSIEIDFTNYKEDM